MQSLLTEFFADNLGDFFIFLRRFADDILETSADSLEHILHFVTVFMGDVERYVQTRSKAFVLTAKHLDRNRKVGIVRGALGLGSYTCRLLDLFEKLEFCSQKALKAA